MQHRLNGYAAFYIHRKRVLLIRKLKHLKETDQRMGLDLKIMNVIKEFIFFAS